MNAPGPRIRTSRAGPRPPRRELVPFLIGIAAGLLLAAIYGQWRPMTADPDLATYLEVRDFVQENFVQPVGREDLLDSALRGLVEDLDEYSRYYSAQQVDQVERETRGSYRGIGVVFRDPIEEAQVLFAMPDSPAERAGLDVGDQILSIDGRSVQGMDALGLRSAIGDPARTALEFVVRSLEGEERSLRVERDVLLDPSVRHARLIDPVDGIGYVAVRSFSERTVAEFDGAVESLREQGLRSLIIDVRGNFGGLLHAAVALANRFLPEGVIVSTHGRDEIVHYRADPDEATLSELPLVVLVDGESASASEVFAAALQDHRAAVLVGSATYGKGTVQRVVSVGEGSALVKLTTSYYYTPAGQNLERTVDPGRTFGIVPDVLVPLEAGDSLFIHALLDLYSAPASARAKLRAWEEREGIVLVPPHPPDAQIEAALALLRGRHPGSEVAERSE